MKNIASHVIDAIYFLRQTYCGLQEHANSEIQTSTRIYVFCCRQSSKQTSRETLEVHFSRVKRSCLSVAIGRFRSILFVSVIQGSLASAIIMIDGSEKPNRQLGFELQSLHVIENCNKSLPPMCKVNAKQTHS